MFLHHQGSSRRSPPDNGDFRSNLPPVRIKRNRSESDETVQSATATKIDKPRNKKSSKKSQNDARSLACPFHKHSDEIWGDIDCSTWRKESIQTVIRHHILDKHMKLNESFSKDDPRRIDPALFTKLKKWNEEGVRLEQKRAHQLWKKAYMTLFGIDDSDEHLVPSPYYNSPDRATTVAKINSRLSDRAIDNPTLVHTEAWHMISRSKVREASLDQEVARIEERYNKQIRELKNKRDCEIREAKERCHADLERYQQPFAAELATPQRINSDNDVTLTGSAPSQSQGIGIGPANAPAGDTFEMVSQNPFFRSLLPGNPIEENSKPSSSSSNLLDIGGAEQHQHQHHHSHPHQHQQSRRRSGRHNSGAKTSTPATDHVASQYTSFQDLMYSPGHDNPLYHDPHWMDPHMETLEELSGSRDGGAGHGFNHVGYRDEHGNV